MKFDAVEFLKSLCRAEESTLGSTLASTLSDPTQATPTQPEPTLEVILSEPTPDHLPPDWHLLWDERAAIMEYDGGLPREQAEHLALLGVLNQMKTAAAALA